MTLSLIKPPPMIDTPNIEQVMPIQQQFNTSFGVGTSKETEELYLKLIEEEHEEWVEDFFSEDATNYEELKELADLLYVTAGYAFQLGYLDIKPVKYRVTDTWDWAITELVGDLAGGDSSEETVGKLIYCLFGYADYMSWDLMEAYRRVHKSNMSKLTADGKVLRREDGKVLKSDLYTPPDLMDLTQGL